MLLGKRPRPPVMRRTRSMSGGMAVDTQATEASNLEAHEEVVMSDSVHPHPHDEDVSHGIKDPQAVVMGTQHDGLVADQTKNVSGAKGYEYDERLVGTVMFPSPTTTITNNQYRQNQTSNPAHAIHTAHDFLRTCGLCRCRLAPGRDIYMYRGDTAFCSLECREKQMKQDQRKEKWKGVSNKDHRVSPPPTATTKASTKSETAACS